MEGLAGGFVGGWFARHFLARSAPLTQAADGRSKPEGAGDRVPAQAPTAASDLSAPTGPSGPRRISEDASTAGRIVLHLGGLGRLGDDDAARHGFTQAGMVAALGLRQGTLAKALSRLEAADVVVSDRRRVSGAPARLKGYRLTYRGEALARDLRRRNQGVERRGAP